MFKRFYIQLLFCNFIIVFMNSSFLTVITTIAEVGALGGLLWQLVLSRQESKARFMIDVYNDQEEKLNRTLDDDSRLDIYARKRGISREQAKEKILATIDINDAFKNYVIYTEKLVGSDLGEKFAMDIKGVISSFASECESGLKAASNNTIRRLCVPGAT